MTDNSGQIRRCLLTKVGKGGGAAVMSRAMTALGHVPMCLRQRALAA